MPRPGRIGALVGLSAIAGGEMQRPSSSKEQPRSISVESVAHAAPPDNPPSPEAPAADTKPTPPTPNKTEKIDGSKARRFEEILKDKNTPPIDRLRELGVQLKGTIQTRTPVKISPDGPEHDVYKKGETEYVWVIIDAMFKLLHSTPGPLRNELRRELEEYARHFRHQERRIEVANEIEERVMNRSSPRQRGKKRVK